MAQCGRVFWRDWIGEKFPNALNGTFYENKCLNSLYLSWYWWHNIESAWHWELSKRSKLTMVNDRVTQGWNPSCNQPLSTVEVNCPFLSYYHREQISIDCNHPPAGTDLHAFKIGSMNRMPKCCWCQLSARVCWLQPSGISRLLMRATCTSGVERLVLLSPEKQEVALNRRVSIWRRISCLRVCSLMTLNPFCPPWFSNQRSVALRNGMEKNWKWIQDWKKIF